MHPCLASAHEALANLEGAHRVHGWGTPMRVVNVSVQPGRVLRMAVFNSIGEPAYVHDVVSSTLAKEGIWESADPTSLATAAGLEALPGSAEPGLFLDVGAGVGFHALAFASIGYRVLAIEPMTQNVLALAATSCLNADALRGNERRGTIRVSQTAAVGPSHARGRGTCAVLSPFRANDFANGQLECTNRSGAAPCSRKHNGATIHSNFTYFFHHRRACTLASERLKASPAPSPVIGSVTLYLSSCARVRVSCASLCIISWLITNLRRLLSAAAAAPTNPRRDPRDAHTGRLLGQHREDRYGGLGVRGPCRRRAHTRHAAASSSHGRQRGGREKRGVRGALRAGVWLHSAPPRCAAGGARKTRSVGAIEVVC